MARQPSLAALEVLAVSDQAVFESVMEYVGLHVEGKVDTNPLHSQVQTESIASIASEVTEETQEYIEATPQLLQTKRMAEDYGYIVSFA